MAMEDIKGLVKELLQEIKGLEVKLDEVVKPLEETTNTLPMASGSLQDVITYTEQSVHQIMNMLNNLLEEAQKLQSDVDFLLSFNPTKTIKEKLEEMKARSLNIYNMLLNIITLMSFQDLASQQIKKVIEALEALKKTLLKIIVSSVEISELSQEQKDKIVGKATEMLTGDRIYQEDVDKLLEELGL